MYPSELTLAILSEMDNFSVIDTSMGSSLVTNIAWKTGDVVLTMYEGIVSLPNVHSIQVRFLVPRLNFTRVAFALTSIVACRYLEISICV